ETILSCRQRLAFHLDILVGLEHGGFVSACAPYLTVRHEVAPDCSSLHCGTAVVDCNVGIADFARCRGGWTWPTCFVALRECERAHKHKAEHHAGNFEGCSHDNGFNAFQTN